MTNLLSPPPSCPCAPRSRHVQQAPSLHLAAKMLHNIATDSLTHAELSLQQGISNPRYARGRQCPMSPSRRKPVPAHSYYGKSHPTAHRLPQFPHLHSGDLLSEEGRKVSTDTSRPPPTFPDPTSHTGTGSFLSPPPCPLLLQGAATWMDFTSLGQKMKLPTHPALPPLSYGCCPPSGPRASPSLPKKHQSRDAGCAAALPVALAAEQSRLQHGRYVSPSCSRDVGHRSLSPSPPGGVTISPLQSQGLWRPLPTLPVVQRVRRGKGGLGVAVALPWDGQWWQGTAVGGRVCTRVVSLWGKEWGRWWALCPHTTEPL